MTVTEAARVWVATKRKLARLDAEIRQAKAAEDVLKTHFAATGKTSFRGIGYARTTFEALDVGLARAELGAKAAKCTVTRTRETLSLLEPVAPKKPAKAKKPAPAA